MPVPVYVPPQQPAHPVYKHQSGLGFTSLNKAVEGTASLSGEGSPSWRRTMPHTIWGGKPTHQPFYQGLADAPDASAIKGSCAQAQTPPFSRSFGSAEIEEADSWDTLHDDISQMVDDESTDIRAVDFERGAFSPIYEEESPEVDSSSSPNEPVTPFGLFVDRATASHDASVTVSATNAYHAPHDPQWATRLPEVTEHQASCQYEVKEPVPAPEVATPSADAEYRRLAECFSQWTAKFVWKICADGMALPESFARAGPSPKQCSDAPPSYLAGSIHSLLLSTLLEPSAILLALWYIARLPVYFSASPLAVDKVRELLFRVELLGDPASAERDAMESTAPFRLVVLGFMLSNKWLSDHTYSNKTWHNISNVPISYLNRLESLALDIFSYDLSISDANWSQWLTFVLSYHTIVASPIYPQPISRPSANPYSLIRKSIEDVIVALGSRESAGGLPQPAFIGLEERRKEQMDKEHAARDVHEIDLDEDGPLRQEYLPRRRVSGAGSFHSAQSVDVLAVRNSQENSIGYGGKLLPPPAKWSPAGDEPILRDSSRVNGHFVPQAAPTVPLYSSYPTSYQNRHICANQNWPGAAYLQPAKPTGLPNYGLEASHHLPSAYNQIPFVHSFAMSHSRSQSLSYGQDNNPASRNHLRSFSQTGQDAGFPMSTTTLDNIWGGSGQYAVPNYAPAYGVAYPPSWLAN